jgi:hypothetical protein
MENSRFIHSLHDFHDCIPLRTGKQLEMVSIESGKCSYQWGKSFWTDLNESLSVSVRIDINRANEPRESLQRDSIDEGITIDFNPDESNANLSIRINFESFSNLIDLRDLQ